MKNPRSGIKGRLNSFAYARQGFAYFLKTQPNGRIHVLLGVAAITLGLYLEISRGDWLWVSSAIALVIMAEMFNTVVEEMADFISPGFDQRIGRIKDVCAGAVLIAAVYAVVVGLVVFLPGTIDLVQSIIS